MRPGGPGGAGKAGFMNRIAVLGAGGWGTALARLLVGKGHEVCLWGRSASHIHDLEVRRENIRYLPGVSLPPEVIVTSDLGRAVSGREVLVFAVPSQAVREAARACLPYLDRIELAVNVAKGIEVGTLRRLSEVLMETLPAGLHQGIAVLSGPSHAEEVGREMPTAVVAAAHVRWTAEAVQEIFMCPYLRVYTNSDVVGVELASALKNVIAIAVGISEGLGFGDNSRAALMTRGLAEISRLGVALGANPLTFAGLAGVGDLIVTCTSRHSRNRRFGIAVGQGLGLKEALEYVGMVVEGVHATIAARELAAKTGIEMPIAEELYGILFEGHDPVAAVTRLMGRDKKGELERG